MKEGGIHPLELFLFEVRAFFRARGFQEFEGPERDSEWYNFDFLRVPADHPARDVQDTFWLKNGELLRTHTTGLQGRIMKKNRPPARFIMPGRVFRREATDSTHETQFYQLDGFIIESEVTMAQMMSLFEVFLAHLFGRVKSRFVPHHYPFVEPGMDVYLEFQRQGKKEFIEILGSGMIHPEVLRHMGLEPRKWQGFAWGMGVDRLMLLKYGIADIRYSYQNDIRFLRQFRGREE